MVSSLFRTDSMPSRMRKRFSLPAYSNKPIYADEHEAEFQYIDYESSRPPQPPASVRPLQTKDEVQLRQAVRSLHQQIDRNEETRSDQAEPSKEQNIAAEAPEVKRTRSRRSIAFDTLSSLSRRLSVVVEPMENEKPGTDGDLASPQDDPFLQFNGLLYSFEFGLPISRNSRVFEAGTPDEANSFGRYRPHNPAARVKRNRYSWGGFDLAHRNQNEGYQDDLVAILEHDETNMNEAAVAAPAATSSSQSRRDPSQRSLYYQDNRRAGIVVDNALADSIAVGATGHKDSAHKNNINTNANDNNNDNSTENIQAFIPLGSVAELSQTRVSGRKRNFVRRLSLSLFGRRKTDPMDRNSDVHHQNTNKNTIRV